MFKILQILIPTFLLSSCATVPQIDPDVQRVTQSFEPEISQYLPDQLNDYDYIGAKNYGEKLGYSLRYKHRFVGSHYADIYIWPVPNEVRQYPHKEIVIAGTDAGLQDINAAQNAGAYEDLEMHEGKIYGSDERVLTEHIFTMTKNNLKVASYLYVSEFNGFFLKARVTMPEHESEELKTVIRDFVLDIFSEISSNIEFA